MGTIRSVVLTHLRQPLIVPYRLSYRTFEGFDPFLVEVEDNDGQRGFSDGHVSPGSSSETREGAWAVMSALIPRLIGKDTEAAKSVALEQFGESKVAVTAVVTAIEVLEGHPAIALTKAAELPLLTPVNAMETAAIEREIEDWLGQGFRTFKVKVGKDVDADLARVAAIQRVGSGPGDAAARRKPGLHAATQAFASRRRCRPTGIELFEQPCQTDEWDANAAVAEASPVPLMLDEPICTLATSSVRRRSGCRLLQAQAQAVRQPQPA